MSFSVTCVHCDAVLKSQTPVPAGKNVKCPKCAKMFTTPAADKAFSVQCVHCRATLRSGTAVPAGKTVMCPKCGQAFTTPCDRAVEKPVPKANFNISIFTGDADAAIAGLMAETSGNAPSSPEQPSLDDDLVTEEEEYGTPGKTNTKADRPG